MMINCKKFLLSGISRNHKWSDSAGEHWNQLRKINRLFNNKTKIVLGVSEFISFFFTKPNFLFSFPYTVFAIESI